jgi:hypothetical protein
MLDRINKIVNNFIEHPRGFLTPKNVVIASSVGLIAYKAISKFVEVLIDFADNKRKIPNLRIIFRKPYEPGLLKVMNNILTTATTDITFLGWRYITAPGYRGRISMQEVADRIEWLSENQANITGKERAIGQTFADKILDLYNKGDEKLKFINLFTGTICAFRDNRFDLFGVRLYGGDKWEVLSVFQRKN